MRSRILFAFFVPIALAACGDDDSTTDTAADPTATTTRDGESGTPSTGDSGTDDPSPPAGDGSDPAGTVTVDGTDYTIVASLQCLVALDEANQISMSGDVEEYDSGEPVEWSYSWDSDDGVNEFTIQISEDLEYRTFGTAQFDDPQVDGRMVTASGTLRPMIGDPVEASFQMDCAG